MRVYTQEKTTLRDASCEADSEGKNFFSCIWSGVKESSLYEELLSEQNKEKLENQQAMKI